MAKTISNVITGVATLSVHNEHDLAEWTKEYAKAGLYSAHLVKDGLSTDRSTHVQFNPTTHTVLWSDFQANIAGFNFWEKTSGGTANWSQMELRFEEPDGEGWVEMTIAPNQGVLWGEVDFEQYTVLGGSLCGFGGHTSSGASVFVWPCADVTLAINTDVTDGSVLFDFNEAEAGCNPASWVLTRVRIELWETGSARESWIGDVTIDDHVYTVEPGGTTPGLVLSSPNVEVGYTEDGVIVTYTTDTADIEVEEETFPINRVITKETAEITCNMAESSMFNIDKAMAGSVLASNVITLGGGVNKLLNLTVEGTSPEGFKSTIYMPRATATGAVGTSYKKGEKNVVPVTFQALKGDEYAVLIVNCAA